MDQFTGAQEQNARNMKDFLELYNKLTERCFQNCVGNFNSRSLSGNETGCVNLCVDRYVKYNQRLMFTFMEFQNAKQDAAIKEMEQAAAEGRQPNIPGLASQGLSYNPLSPEQSGQTSDVAQVPAPVNMNTDTNTGDSQT